MFGVATHTLFTYTCKLTRCEGAKDYGLEGKNNGNGCRTAYMATKMVFNHCKKLTFSRLHLPRLGQYATPESLGDWLTGK